MGLTPKASNTTSVRMFQASRPVQRSREKKKPEATNGLRLEFAGRAALLRRINWLADLRVVL
jgi:hypothetical protein